MWAVVVVLRKRDARAIRRGIILADMLVDAYMDDNIEQIARIQQAVTAFRRLTRVAYARRLTDHWLQ